jgi:hypothetical protein
MQEMDCVEVIVEKEKYARDGVHKGMQGWICWHECIDGAWLVDFPQPMDKPQIATIGIHEVDMKVIPQMDARVNERIKAQFEDAGNSKKALAEKPDDLSDYLI